DRLPGLRGEDVPAHLGDLHPGRDPGSETIRNSGKDLFALAAGARRTCASRGPGAVAGSRLPRFAGTDTMAPAAYEPVRMFPDPSHRNGQAHASRPAAAARLALDPASGARR